MRFPSSSIGVNAGMYTMSNREITMIRSTWERSGVVCRNAPAHLPPASGGKVPPVVGRDMEER